ncbi:MAG: hypothetical protein GY806_13700, partial [Gammaproteobacteria bacterium]|nr:hypothetical protein [Gammaproteobacteria bacterium]
VSGSNYSSSVTALANAKVSTSGGNLSLTVTGGINLLAGTATAAALSTSAFTSDQAVAQANAELTASGNVTINPSGSLTLTSGTSTTTTSINGGTASATANASLSGAALTAMTTGNISLTSAQVALTNAASFSAGASFNFNGGSIVTGGNLDIVAGNSLTINGGLNVGGSSLVLSAGSTLDLNTNLGSSASRLNHNVTLIGQSINVNDDIYLGNNTLTLAGNTATGSINIENSSLNRHVKVDTQGLLSVTGNKLNISNVLTGYSGTTFSVVGVNAGTIDVVINGDMTVQAGDFLSTGAGTPVSVDTTVVASGNISVSARSLNVLAGDVNVMASGGGSPNPVTAAAELTAGGNLTVNVTNAFNMAAGSASANASSTDAATAQANSTVSAGSNLSIQAASATISGGTETTGGTGSVAAFATTSLNAGTGLSIVATGDITASKADISGAGVYISAGNNFNLLTSSTTVGSGTVSGISGDSLLLSTMSNEGIALPASNNPNAKFEAGGTMVTGDITLTGSNSYLWFSADMLTVDSITAPAAPLLVQYSPFTITNTIGVEDIESLAEQTNYNNLNHFSTLPATTIAIGGTQQTGSISVGNNGVMNLGAKNIIFLNTPNDVNSLDNIITTGTVADSGIVASLASVFVSPRLENIDVDNSSWWLEEQERERLLVENETDDSSGMCTAL